VWGSLAAWCSEETVVFPQVCATRRDAVDFHGSLARLGKAVRDSRSTFPDRHASRFEFVAVSRVEMTMKWEHVTGTERADVIAMLEREAERLEQDAAQLERAAVQLGRPSLVERQETKASAFRAAIEFLTRSLS